MDTTLDGLLNRSIELEQPKTGYRVAIDTVLLAASVPANAKDKIADFGCGVGGAMLCLAYRVPGISVTGYEIQPELTELCQKNIERNKLQAQLAVKRSDVTKLTGGEYDYVMMNPPYHEEASHDTSPTDIKRIANTESDGDLKLWIASAEKVLKPEGTLTLIHRADRRKEIIAELQKSFGAIEVLPLQSKADSPPKRIILRAKKGKKATINECLPLILHSVESKYSHEAEQILRYAATLEFNH